MIQRETKWHKTLQHKYIMTLIDHEVVDEKDKKEARLLFPYHQVTRMLLFFFFFPFFLTIRGALRILTNIYDQKPMFNAYISKKAPSQMLFRVINTPKIYCWYFPIICKINKKVPVLHGPDEL